jgi:hypothetical protein
MASLEGTSGRVTEMSTVFSAHAVSVDGDITGVTHLHNEVER